MKLIIIRRFTGTIFVLWGALTMVFILSRVLPGDPVDIMLGERAVPEAKEKLREELGLNKDYSLQYIEYLRNLSKGDLGTSFFYRSKVLPLILERFKNTVQLAIFALIISLFISFSLSIISAFWPNSRFDRVIILLTTGGFSIPSFWSGPILILLFSVWAGLFPIGGKEGIISAVLPALTLSIPTSSGLTRHLRAYLIGARSSFFIKSAVAKGRTSKTAIITHALPYAILPFLTVVGLEVGMLFTGAVIVEAVFSWPGLGSLVILSIQTRDFPVLQGCVLFISFVYVIVNLFTDILYSLADPRVKGL